MNNYFSILFLFFSAALIQCNESKKNNTHVNELTNSKVSVIAEHIFDSIPSGSGMAIMGDTLFIISDDAPNLFRISIKDNSVITIPIAGNRKKAPTAYRIERDIKRDLEAATFGNLHGRNVLLAFPSGSKSPLRDTMFIGDSAQADFSLTSLYTQLQKQTNTSAKQWNIEGVAVVNDSLLLLNRGNNMIISINWNEFTAYTETKESSVLAFSSYTLKMPLIAEREARLSGICRINDSLAVICASVEDTDDWTKDGPVLGSYICLLDTRKRIIISQYLLTDEKGNPRKEKIESVEFLKRDVEGSYQVLAITDNDDGKTKLFTLLLK